jgi:hypothetical protein
MRTGRRLKATTVRFFISGALVVGLVTPQAMAFLAAERRHSEADESTAPSGAGKFSVAGRAKGLFPGGSKILKLKVRNPMPYWIKVKLLTVTVGKPSKPGCKRGWLQIKREITPRVKVADEAVARVTVTAKLSREAGDACQGARWPLRYDGTAVRL